MHIHPKPIEWLHFETTFASVTGRQENGEYLPFVPAHKLRFELRLEKEDVWSLKDGYIAAYTTTAFDQNRAAPDETATSGYTLLDLDRKYTDHLSTLKEVGLFNPGRNIALSIRIPFSIAKNE